MFIYKYLLSGFGWHTKIEPQILANKQDGMQFAKDIISTIPKLFSRHKTYIKRKNYFITVFPFNRVLDFLYLIFLPFAFIHELTHAFAIRYLNSIRSIILLPLITEIPFMSVCFFMKDLPVWLFIPSLLFGLTGFTSIAGDGISFLRLRKRERIFGRFNLWFSKFQLS